MVTIVVSEELLSLSVVDGVNSGIDDLEVGVGDGCGVRGRWSRIGVGGMTIKDGESIKADSERWPKQGTSGDK